MSIVSALKGRYKRKQEFKKYQKGIERKREYRTYINKHIKGGKPTKKLMSYAQWHEHVYEKYEKPKPKPKKTPMRRTESKPSASKTTRTRAVERGLRKAGIDWEKDKPSKRYKRSREKR